jgi:nascent polypeptide-associated complex subunit alpha
MIPGGMDPKKMQAMMRQMGIRSEEISANSVVIETETQNIVIESPQVTKISMQGNESFQISGVVRVEERVSSEDVRMVMEQASCSEGEAKEALEKSGGDIAEAILLLTEGKE